jgi:RNA polymerase sigma-70 factor (ECF subfamily)
MECLVIRAQQGSAVALEQLLRIWYPRLLGSAKRMLRNDDAAKDVVQEALLKLAQNLASLRNPGAFGAWAGQILRRRCLAHLKQQKRHPCAGEVDCHTMAAPDADPETLAIRDDNALAEAVDSLGTTSREVVRMHYFFGLSLREIAGRARISEGAVKLRLHRARNQLRQRLTPPPVVTPGPSGNAH